MDIFRPIYGISSTWQFKTTPLTQNTRNHLFDASCLPWFCYSRSLRTTQKMFYGTWISQARNFWSKSLMAFASCFLFSTQRLIYQHFWCSQLERVLHRKTRLFLFCRFPGFQNVFEQIVCLLWGVCCVCCLLRSAHLFISSRCCWGQLARSNRDEELS